MQGESEPSDTRSIDTIRPWFVVRAAVSTFLVCLVAYCLICERPPYGTIVLATGVGVAGILAIAIYFRDRFRSSRITQPPRQHGDAMIAQFLWLVSLSATAAYGVMFVYHLGLAAAAVPAGYTGPWTFIRPDIITKVPFWMNGNPLGILLYCGGFAAISLLVRPNWPAAVVASLAAATLGACSSVEAWYFWVD